MHLFSLSRIRANRFILLALISCVGCGFNPRWPDQPAARRVDDGDTTLAFRVDGAKKPNYFQHIHDGVITQLAFDDNGDGDYDATIDRRQDSPDWPHCILILDGA